MREEGNNQRKSFNNRRGSHNNRGGNRGNQEGRNNDQQDKKKFIQRDGQPHKRGKERRGFKNKQGAKKEERDLDRELRDYWISKKGGEKGEGSNCYST